MGLDGWRAREGATSEPRAMQAVAELKRDIERLKDVLVRIVRVARLADERTAQMSEALKNVARNARDEYEAVEHLRQISGQVSEDVTDAAEMLRSIGRRDGD